jgi:hypothetical protein
MADHLHVLDQESLHFFAALEKLLACPTFLPKGEFLVWLGRSAILPTAADFPTGGTLGFTCTHAYPHSSKSSIDNLHHTLKGLDMVVYQALKRLAGFAQVATVLDDHSYQDWMNGYSYNKKSKSNDGVGNVHESDTLLGKVLHTPILWQDFNDEEQLDPESVTHHVRCDCDTKQCEEQVYSRQKVMWLNYSPGSKSFRELAVAFITVSFVKMKLSRRVRSVTDRFPVVWKLP